MRFAWLCLSQTAQTANGSTLCSARYNLNLIRCFKLQRVVGRTVVCAQEKAIQVTLESLSEIRKSFDFSQKKINSWSTSFLNRESPAALAVHRWLFSVIFLLSRVRVLNNVVHGVFWINRFLHHDNGRNNEIVIFYAGSVDLKNARWILFFKFNDASRAKAFSRLLVRDSLHRHPQTSLI